MIQHKLDLNLAEKAVNQFKTGIRKEFRISGHKCRMTVDEFDGKNILMIDLHENVPYFMEIEDLSAEAVVSAVRLASISRIMNL